MANYMIRFCETRPDRYSGYWIPMWFPAGTTLEEVKSIAERVHETKFAVQVYEDQGEDARGRIQIKPVGPELINADK